jgi:hypothetical protein
MNDLPRHTLTRIIARHGREICDEPKRVEALLRDLCGAHRREINIIAGALEERVAADLIAAGKSVPRDVLLARLAARLRDHLAYTPEAARWGVETWAVALGILSEAEVEERARAEAADSARRSSPTPPTPPPPTAAARPTTAQPPHVNPPPPPQPKRGPTYAPPQPPPRQPTPTRPTPNPPPRTGPPPAAPAPRPTTPPVIVASAPPARRHAPPPVVLPPLAPMRRKDRRGITLRGCFVTFVLLFILAVAAIFVIPAIIGVLQEEQARPSINEPRIRR